MNRVLVLYDSATGSTAKMAQLVAEGAGSIDGIEVRVLCRSVFLPRGCSGKWSRYLEDK
jgi:multimeric flavodoxin WrbA